MTEFDVLVIGGGINGAAIARDAALRGMRVGLFEKGDFGSGTTQYSSRLIHGGLRYLEQFQVDLVFEALQEREHLLRIAPHLVRPLEFLLPIYLHSTRPYWYTRLGLIGYDVLSFLKSLPNHTALSSPEAVRLIEPGIQAEGLVGGFTYYDCQAPFPERLTLATLKSAEALGARVRNYHEVVSITVENGRVGPVRVKDLLHGKTTTHTAQHVINASGPWVDVVNGRLTKRLTRQIGGTKGSHIVVPPWRGAPTRSVYIEARKDRRPIFIIPWRGSVLIGTTDIPYEDSLDAVFPTREEVEYFLAEANALFPAARLTPASVLHAYAGVRPLPVVRREAPGDIPRSHIIRDHAEDGVAGFYSVVSGKITTHRSLAKEMVDRISRKRCATHKTPVWGGETGGLERYKKRHVPRIRKKGFTKQQAEYFIDMFGASYPLMLRFARGKWRRRVSRDHPDILAEVVYCIEHEHVRRLDDFFQRRTGIGSGKGQGLDAVEVVAAVLGDRLGWSEARKRREIRAYTRLVRDRYTPR